jgi:hypothetical protein
MITWLDQTLPCDLSLEGWVCDMVHNDLEQICKPKRWKLFENSHKDSCHYNITLFSQKQQWLPDSLYICKKKTMSLSINTSWMWKEWIEGEFTRHWWKSEVRVNDQNGSYPHLVKASKKVKSSCSQMYHGSTSFTWFYFTTRLVDEVLIWPVKKTTGQSISCSTPSCQLTRVHSLKPNDLYSYLSKQHIGQLGEAEFGKVRDPRGRYQLTRLVPLTPWMLHAVKLYKVFINKWSARWVWA